MEATNKYDRINELIDLYVAGNMSKALFEELRQWAAASEANNRYVRERLELWTSSGMLKPESVAELEEKYARIERRIADNEGTAPPQPSPVGRGAEATSANKDEHNIEVTSVPSPLLRVRVGLFLRIAAAVILLMLLPLGAFLVGQSSIKSALTDIKTETALGSRTKLTLPDGTTVWLNAGSTLQYPQDFGVSNRRVTLTGEACFDVKHNERLPFLVNTKEVELQVLGTKFTFTDYPGDTFAQVDLLRGKVRLKEKSSGQLMQLKPNQRMQLDKRTSRMIRRNINATQSADWTEGRLTFDELTLRQIAAIISRSYNVNVSVAATVQNETFCGSFDSSRNSAEDILRAIAQTKQMKYLYKDGTYQLY